MFVGAIEALLMGIWIGNGDRLPTVGFGHQLLAVPLALAPAALMFSEALFHPDAWRRLRQHDGPWTVRDMLLWRHIPDLHRSSSTPSSS